MFRKFKVGFWHIRINEHIRIELSAIGFGNIPASVHRDTKKKYAEGRYASAVIGIYGDMTSLDIRMKASILSGLRSLHM